MVDCGVLDTSRRGGTVYTVTDNGAGALAGDGSGAIDYIGGRVVLRPSHMPDAGAEFAIDYQLQQQVVEVLTPGAPGAGGNITIAADNAFLSPAIAAQLLAAGETSFRMGRFNSDFPFPRIDFARSTIQATIALDGKIGLVWLNPSTLNNTYAFAMPGKIAREEGVETVSQLVEKFRADPKMQFAFDMEFVGRSDGLEPMEKLYGFHLERRNIKQMDPGLVYTALKNEQIDAGLVYTSDGRNKGFDLKVLADDKGFFPAYAATPVVRQEVLDANPKLADELNALSAKINDENMRDMNAKVDIDHQAVSRVASDFLKQEGLVQ